MKMIKSKQIHARLKQAQALAELSSCTRRKVGALIIDPVTLSVVADGYNGPPRKGPHLCGGDGCLRDRLEIKSGDQTAIGCYHAEQNAIYNAARHGARTQDTVMICTTAPCLNCARAIYHAGIKTLYIPNESYTSSEGVEFLAEYRVMTFNILP